MNLLCLAALAATSTALRGAPQPRRVGPRAAGDTHNNAVRSRLARGGGAPRSRVAARAAAGDALTLEDVIRQKLRLAEELKTRHETGAGSDVQRRLEFVADRGNLRFSAALRRGDGTTKQLSVVADVKRKSPHGGPDGGGASLAAFGNAGRVAAEMATWPVDALSVCADPLLYGGKLDDVGATARALREGYGDERPPLLAKDIVVDPIQIALAAELGADAVMLSSSVLGATLPAMLDACTIAGIEGAVEVHTPNELNYALQAGATLLICSNVDRATGVYHEHQALGLKGLVPANIVCLASGGLGDSINDVRALAVAGYDGVVLGRRLVADPEGGRAFVDQVRALEVDPVDQLAWG